MTPNVEPRRTGSAWNAERGGRGRVSAAGRRPGASHAAPAGAHAEADVEETTTSGAFGAWENLGFDLTPRAQPAALLFAMIERMGGTATSHWKGKYVNLVI